MPDRSSASTEPGGRAPDSVHFLMEEYRQLYTLVVYRLNALDQRVPIASAALTTVLGGVVVLPPLLQLGLLVGLPLSLVWLVRTTINHARSLEDALRRIEQIEREVKAEAGRAVMTFQSSHPSRGVQVGGRTGEETVQSVLAVAATLLAGCVLMMAFMLKTPMNALGLYSAYICGVTAMLIAAHRQLRAYRYVPRQSVPVQPGASG